MGSGEGGGPVDPEVMVPEDFSTVLTRCQGVYKTLCKGY